MSRGRAGLTAATGLLGLVLLAGCAGVPEAPADPGPVAGGAPAVLTAQSEQVRAEVAGRLLAARVAGDPALLDVAATGPAGLVEALRVRLDGPLPDAAAVDPVPAAVLVAPRTAGWPRWFATVTDPATAPAAAAESTVGVSPGPAPTQDLPEGAEPTVPAPDVTGAPPSGAPEPAAFTQELPVLELYASDAARSPYRLWGRLTLLPGAEIPAFPAAAVGAFPLADGGDPAGVAVEASEAPSAPPAPSPGSRAPSPGASPAPSGTALPRSAVEGLSEEDAELLTAVSDLAVRYASVLTDGDASPEAASFEPDPFVEAVRARAEAEAAAVAQVATTTVVHEPLAGGEVLYAVRTAAGDLLAVTAVQTTTTMTVRDGAGELRPGTELRAAAGIESTEGTLTARSVAALAFVVPAEQGAIRLVAVGEGLVEAEAT